ncbi:unnamed protein product [Caenorhabditis sp. 36 PRJEB53466]|nr:unnamed protein product [Caenorhabditis sp. 36 PRJEB53466]
MSKRNDSFRKHRKSRSSKKDDVHQFPAVTFNGSESIDIPADEGKSPVQSHMSLASNPADFKFMDEIALLKRGRIDKDAPKHPYSRRGQQEIPEIPESAVSSSTISTNSTNSSLQARSSSVMTLLAGTVDGDEQNYTVGQDGLLKVWNLKEGGERFELSSANDERVAVFQQCEGQTCLFTFKMNAKDDK